MKIIPFILFLSFLVIAITPLMYISDQLPQAQCGDQSACCIEEDEMTCDKEDMECCPPGMCNPVQCVFCCFVCPVTNDKIVIRIFDSGIKTHLEADQFLLSDFTSECWQPPKYT